MWSDLVPKLFVSTPIYIKSRILKTTISQYCINFSKLNQSLGLTRPLERIQILILAKISELLQAEILLEEAVMSQTNQNLAQSQLCKASCRVPISQVWCWQVLSKTHPLRACLRESREWSDALRAQDRPQHRHRRPWMESRLGNLTVWIALASKMNSNHWHWVPIWIRVWDHLWELIQDLEVE